MQLCVGAASRRVVEEAARLQVHQIVASRRQVAHSIGYIGLSPETLVKLVRDLSGGETQVVRDHGGPLQGGFTDDGVEALDADTAAGFDSLHIDVCELPHNEQCDALVELCKRYANFDISIEVGGEHEHASWNTQLLSAVLSTGIRPSYVVVGASTHVSADRQIGHMHDHGAVRTALSYAHKTGVKTKVHNMDWVGDRLSYGDTFDAYNLAPELGQVEVRAILTVLPPRTALELLEYAYDSSKWRRWFGTGIGTRVERAECAIRYLLEDPHVIDIINRTWDHDYETFVRGCIRDAIVHG
jgi:hypothetical protein